MREYRYWGAGPASLLLFVCMFTGKRGVLDRWEAVVFLALYATYLGVIALWLNWRFGRSARIQSPTGSHPLERQRPQASLPDWHCLSDSDKNVNAYAESGYGFHSFRHGFCTSKRSASRQPHEKTQIKNKV